MLNSKEFSELADRLAELEFDEITDADLNLFFELSDPFLEDWDEEE